MLCMLIQNQTPSIQGFFCSEVKVHMTWYDNFSILSYPFFTPVQSKRQPRWVQNCLESGSERSDKRLSGNQSLLTNRLLNFFIHMKNPNQFRPTILINLGWHNSQAYHGGVGRLAMSVHWPNPPPQEWYRSALQHFCYTQKGTCASLIGG